MPGKSILRIDRALIVKLFFQTCTTSLSAMDYSVSKRLAKKILAKSLLLQNVWKILSLNSKLPLSVVFCQEDVRKIFQMKCLEEVSDAVVDTGYCSRYSSTSAHVVTRDLCLSVYMERKVLRLILNWYLYNIHRVKGHILTNPINVLILLSSSWWE